VALLNLHSLVLIPDQWELNISGAIYYIFDDEELFRAFSTTTIYMRK